MLDVAFEQHSKLKKNIYADYFFKESDFFVCIYGYLIEIILLYLLAP